MNTIIIILTQRRVVLDLHMLPIIAHHNIRTFCNDRENFSTFNCDIKPGTDHLLPPYLLKAGVERMHGWHLESWMVNGDGMGE